MRCDEASPELSAWLDGELPPETARALETHLEGCAPCRAERARLERAVGGVKRLERRRAPERFADSILARVFPGASLAGEAACAVLEEGDLSAHADRELDTTRTTVVEEHLSGCPGCVHEKRDVEVASRALRALPRRAAPAALLIGIGERLDSLATAKRPVPRSEPAPAPRVLDLAPARTAEPLGPSRAPWWTTLEKLRGIAAAGLLFVSMGLSAAFTAPTLEAKRGGFGTADREDAMERVQAYDVPRPAFATRELTIECANVAAAFARISDETRAIAGYEVRGNAWVFDASSEAAARIVLLASRSDGELVVTSPASDGASGLVRVILLPRR